MRIPIQIKPKENENSTIHFLENPEAGIELVKKYINELKQDMNKSKKDKEKIKEDLKNWEESHNNKCEEIKKDLTKKLDSFWNLLRKDNLRHQNSKISLHKSIQQMRKDKIFITVKRIFYIRKELSKNIKE